MSAIEYRRIGAECIDEIQGLWEQLNGLHADVSSHFGERFKGYSFAQRKKSLLEDARDGELCIFVAHDPAEGRDVGYCVSSFRGRKQSEIESLFLERSHRGRRIGEALMERSMDWLKEQGARDVIICVVSGNEDVMNFYRRHGFDPYCIIMRRVEDN
ncbi:GNAT family N-acetyltransferase [Salidesulfovibrio onnuriiensis]|uniref:GNAT family N-acetyltransferase n=1 Tax=Salidesulfovibrio onnuriiensis TaxID=2583823 RepID=UPI0011C6EE31|nr:GNAT family N-acetyltransferase [Salidesulfovibrio onnuriiensis]